MAYSANSFKNKLLGHIDMGFPIPSFQADVALKSKEKTLHTVGSQQCFYIIYLNSNLSFISGLPSFGRYLFFMC